MVTDDKVLVKALIERLRREIDELDEEIIAKVRTRTEKAVQIARLKRSNNIPLVNGTRETVVFSRYATALGRFGRTMAAALLLKSRETETDFGGQDEDSPPENRG